MAWLQEMITNVLFLRKSYIGVLVDFIVNTSETDRCFHDPNYTSIQYQSVSSFCMFSTGRLVLGSFWFRSKFGSQLIY